MWRRMYEDIMWISSDFFEDYHPMKGASDMENTFTF